MFLVGPQPVGSTADPLKCSWLVLSLWETLQIHCHVLDRSCPSFDTLKIHGPSFGTLKIHGPQLVGNTADQLSYSRLVFCLWETLQIHCRVPGWSSACGKHCRSMVIFSAGPLPVGNTADPLSCSWLVLSLWETVGHYVIWAFACELYV